jgi:hypothetical protein
MNVPSSVESTRGDVITSLEKPKVKHVHGLCTNHVVMQALPQHKQSTMLVEPRPPCEGTQEKHRKATTEDLHITIWMLLPVPRWSTRGLIPRGYAARRWAMVSVPASSTSASMF